jgi:hypothetical protein
LFDNNFRPNNNFVALGNENPSSYDLSSGSSLGPTTLGAYTGEWVKIELNILKTFNRYRIALQSDWTYGGSKPYDWVLIGSTDNIVWNLIDKQMNITNWPTSTYCNTINTIRTSAKYIAIVFTKNSNSISESKSGRITITELDFFYK